MGAYATRFVCRYVRFAHAHGFTPVARLSVTALPMVAFHFYAPTREVFP